MKKVLSIFLTLCVAVSFSFGTITSAYAAGTTGSNSAYKVKADVETVKIDKSTVKASGSSIRKMTPAAATNRWAATICSYIFSETSDTFSILDVTGGKIYLDTYNASSYELIAQKQIPFELESFGGFYSGETYNYIVFGQTNNEESNYKEVIRVVKYDKSFNRISAAAVKNCYTIEPFCYSGTRMEEANGQLVLHTSRLRYASADGLNHQSQLTVVINTDTMSVVNDLSKFQANHVSHSFNQFVRFDGDIHVLVDHGDAYPRSIVLNKYNGSKYTETELFTIPGNVGANCTGVTVGGFEVSENNYLVAINTIDHSKVSSYTSYTMQGLGLDERDVVLLVSEKSNTSAAGVRKLRFTDYTGKDKLAGTPFLVKVSDDRFALLWTEYSYGDEEETSYNGVKYIFVDGNGNPLSNVMYDKSAYLPLNSQPMVKNGKIAWYVGKSKGKRTIYAIDAEAELTTGGSNGIIVGGVKDGGRYKKPTAVSISSASGIKSAVYQKNLGEYKSFDSTKKIKLNGAYTIKLTNANNDVKTVKFTVNDTQKPTVTGVKNRKSYSSARTIKFKDNCGISKATLNGRKIKSGKTVSAKGSYKLVVTDVNGLKTTVSFKIK